MSERSGADRVDHGEASLGEAQSRNDSDTDYIGEDEPPEEERGNEDPAPNAP